MTDAATTPRGVLLMTYGSPSSLDDVERYLTAVRGGRAPDDALLVEFRRRYEVIGGSPLIERTRAQADALERRLGDGWRVRAAMRFSEPSIEAALRDLAADGIRDVVAIVLSPQFSPLLMGGYARALDAAREAIGPDGADRHHRRRLVRSAGLRRGAGRPDPRRPRGWCRRRTTSPSRCC